MSIIFKRKSVRKFRDEKAEEAVNYVEIKEDETNED